MCRALSRLLFLARLAFRSASCRCPSERAWVRARVAPSSLPGSLFARLVVAAPHERAPSSCARPGRADSSVWTHRRSSAAGSASGARRPRSQSGCFESGCGSASSAMSRSAIGMGGRSSICAFPTGGRSTSCSWRRDTQCRLRSRRTCDMRSGSGSSPAGHASARRVCGRPVLAAAIRTGRWVGRSRACESLP
jgi:hypothetical protein